MKILIVIIAFLTELLSNYSLEAIPTKVKLIVPLYIYPGNNTNKQAWSQVTEAASKVSVVAIINPNSGPGNGSTPDEYYQEELTKMKKAFKRYNTGSIMIGYVSTNYTKRSKSEVESDIRKYSKWPQAYRPNGIFFDEQSNELKHLKYYQDIYRYTKSIKAFENPLIVTNPGEEDIPEKYFNEKEKAFDVVVAFEKNYTMWQSRSFPSFFKTRKSTDLAVMVYDCPKEKWTDVFNKAIKSNFGYIYITDEVKVVIKEEEILWTKLPTYFTQEVDLIASRSKIGR